MDQPDDESITSNTSAGKKRKFLLNNIIKLKEKEEMGNFPNLTNVKLEELTKIDFHACFGCYGMNHHAIKEDKDLESIQQLIVDNMYLPKLTVAHLVHDHFNRYFREKYQQEWPLEAVIEHVHNHIKLPTDEVIEQIEIYRTLRNRMKDHIISITDEEKTIINQVNFKMLCEANDRILKLLMSKKDLPTMLGFSQQFHY